jgi:hypothetical protein
MTTVSITAPRFTDEQDREEEANLSPEERAQIKSDIYGTDEETSVVEESPEVRAQAIAEMQNELDQIPAHEKQDYMQALEVCPELVERETRSILFLRREGFHAKVRAVVTVVTSCVK